MFKLNSKKIGAIGLAIIMLFGIVGSMAYFSDYAVVDNVAGTAGTVSIALDSDISMLDENGMDIMGPGDMYDASFLITNMGNKSIDVKTTIALTVESEHFDLVFSGDSNTQSEFDLYLASDVAMGYLFESADGSTYVATKAADMSDKALGQVGYIPVEDATPLEIKAVEDNIITYELPVYNLNGNMTLNEYETIDGINTYKHDNDFVLVFHRLTGNTWQDCVLTIDVIVEAKQHENTAAGWEIVAQNKVVQGSLEQFVVDGEYVITDVNGNVN